MPTLSASDYTQYLKFKAAAASPIQQSIQSRTNATTSQSALNAQVLASQAARVVTPNLTPLYASDSVPFAYTGSAQGFVVPPTVYALQVTLNGAGGETASNGSEQGEGGAGGYVSGTLPVTPGETLTIIVGGATGFGGGGAAGAAGGGRGGGRTAILRNGADIVTAGGGGGGGLKTQGGSGGAAVGASGAALAGISTGVGIVMDSLGNLFVSNFSQHTILKITPAGVASVFAGSNGVSGTTDATGSAARFNNPEGLAIDSSDNLYVGEAGNHAIRKITPAAVVTTLAGGSEGDDDGTGAAAKFSAPAGLVCDGSDTLYVCDQSNNKIRKVVISTGVVTTFAGPAAGTTTAGDTDGTGSAARFRDPFGITLSGGTLYVVESTGHRVRSITVPGAVVTTIAGSTSASSGATDANGTSARFNDPRGIASDGTYLYVSELGNNKIRRVTIASPYTVTSYTGTANTQMPAGWVNGTSLAAARFDNPYGLWYSSGALYVTDGDSNALVRKVTSTRVTNVITDATGGTQTAVGTGGTGAGAASGTTGGAGKSGDQAGGGGGGYFGGGGGTTSAAGAGGSSFVGLLLGSSVSLQGGGSASNTNGSATVSFTYGFKDAPPRSTGTVNNPNALSTLSYAGTSGALSSSRTQQSGGLPTGFKNSQGSYFRVPGLPGWKGASPLT
jgi:hypothetical protein